MRSPQTITDTVNKLRLNLKGGDLKVRYKYLKKYN